MSNMGKWHREDYSGQLLILKAYQVTGFLACFKNTRKCFTVIHLSQQAGDITNYIGNFIHIYFTYLIN